MNHLTTTEIEAGLTQILESPKDNGALELIVRRPNPDEREILETGELNETEGLAGDCWKSYGTVRPDAQITLMNSRCIALLAQDENRWALAGDQLYVDLNLSNENLPIGTKLQIGSAILETTAIPHNGCKKFVERFGMEAMKFVNSPVGKELHLRGIYAKVIQAGVIKKGDLVKKI